MIDAKRCRAAISVYTPELSGKATPAAASNARRPPSSRQASTAAGSCGISCGTHLVRVRVRVRVRVSPYPNRGILRHELRYPPELIVAEHPGLVRRRRVHLGVAPVEVHEHVEARAPRRQPIVAQRGRQRASGLGDARLRRWRLRRAFGALLLAASGRLLIGRLLVGRRCRWRRLGVYRGRFCRLAGRASQPRGSEPGSGHGGTCLRGREDGRHASCVIPIAAVVGRHGLGCRSPSRASSSCPNSSPCTSPSLRHLTARRGYNSSNTVHRVFELSEWLRSGRRLLRSCFCARPEKAASRSSPARRLLVPCASSRSYACLCVRPAWHRARPIATLWRLAPGVWRAATILVAAGVTSVAVAARWPA